MKINLEIGDEMNTTKGYQTKEKLIRIAARLFLEKGYHATGINEILAKAEVPKGSFYFHFKTKKELAVKVAEYYANRIEEWFNQTAQGRSWRDFIAALVADMKIVAEKGRHLGCPLGVLGVEIALTEPDISNKYAESMDRITAIFCEVLKVSGLSSSEADNMAKKAFFIYQGYLQYYRMTKKLEVFDLILRDVGNLVD